MSRPDISKVIAGKYELVVGRWDQITSKPGEPFNFTRHRRGDVVDLNVEEARRLVLAGAVKPAKAKTDRTAPAAAPAGPRNGQGETKPPTIDEILADVGDDADKAKVALEAEQAKGDDARATLVSKLEAVITKATS